MIIATKDGRRYELTQDDQDEMRRLAIANGGDLQAAIEEFHQKKFGEPFPGTRPKPLTETFKATTIDNPPHVAKRDYVIVADFVYDTILPIVGDGRDLLTSVHLKTEEGFKVQHVAGDRFFVFDSNVSGCVQVASADLFNTINSITPGWR